MKTKQMDTTTKRFGKEKRKIWKRSETLLFLKCYRARKEEFQHSRKKRFAYANVCQDMLDQGFSDPSITPVTLEGKMRTLFNAYKTAKNMGNICKTPYLAELNEIFDDNPIISNVRTDDTLFTFKQEDSPTEFSHSTCEQSDQSGEFQMNEYCENLSQSLSQNFNPLDMDENDMFLQMIAKKMKVLPQETKLRLQEKFLKDVNGEIIRSANF